MKYSSLDHLELFSAGCRYHGKEFWGRGSDALRQLPDGVRIKDCLT